MATLPPTDGGVPMRQGWRMDRQDNAAWRQKNKRKAQVIV
jgi:hypothetical protein